jgi:hypothetical protein
MFHLKFKEPKTLHITCFGCPSQIKGQKWTAKTPHTLDYMKSVGRGGVRINGKEAVTRNTKYNDSHHDIAK